MPSEREGYFPAEGLEFREQAEKDIYGSSQIVEKIGKSENPKIAILDVDSTITGNPEKQKEVRNLLEEQGYAVVFVSSRTEEVMMSGSEFVASTAKGLNRKAPRLGKSAEGLHVPASPDELGGEFEGLYNPEIIAGSTGTSVLVRSKDGGYNVDAKFEEELKYDSESWRREIMALLTRIDPKRELFTLPVPENFENYDKGTSTVSAPNFRVELAFTPQQNDGGESHKQQFLELLNTLKDSQDSPEETKKLLLNLRTINDSNPGHGRFSLFLVPKRGYKARAADHIVREVAEKLDNPQNLELLIVGDSLPDLAMGLYSGVKHKATFLLAGGSRLTSHLLQEELNDFAGEKIGAIKKRIKKFADDQGYEFKPPLGQKRKVVIGDEAFPGTKSVETLLAYLKNSE